MIDLKIDGILDPVVRENTQKLQLEFETNPIIKGQWRLVEIALNGVVTNFKYPHYLKFTPKDIIQLSKTGSGDVTYNYSLFDRNNIDLTTTGAVTVRLLVGKAGEL